jgi:probable phosphoglycerate mutase
MITKKEFYFIRHGQTDYNLLGNKVDHPDVSLNAYGREQAKKIEPLIVSLNISNICFSPFKRAKETKDIISSRLAVKEWEIPHLGECSLNVWQEMTTLDLRQSLVQAKPFRNFCSRSLMGSTKRLIKKDKF